MQCIVCSHTIPTENSMCPRCSFPLYTFGNSPTEIELMTLLAEKHRPFLLQHLDFGVHVYRWKDVDGNICLDRRFRRSFGMGQLPLNTRTWLPDHPGVHPRAPGAPAAAAGY